MQTIDELNIAHVVFAFGYGGLERRILRLIDGLATDRVNFHIISLRDSDGAFLEPGPRVTHEVLHAQPGIDVRAIAALRRYLRAHDVHIVHSHNWVSMLEGIVCARLAHVPVAVHGEHGASRFLPEQLRWRRTLVQRLLARAADRIVPVNDPIARRVREVWGLGDNAITVIQNGVDVAKFAPTEARRGEEIVIGSISRLEPIKNFPCLVRAVALLNREYGTPRYRLVIVGAGSELERLDALARELGATDFIEFPGATDAPEDWYGKFDIYVNCSFSEGMSNTVLEAMACGLPVVASDVAGHRTWLDEGENAVFFPSDEPAALATALASLDEPARRRIGATNRTKVVDRYSQATFIAAYRRLYTELLAARGYRYHFDD